MSIHVTVVEGGSTLFLRMKTDPNTQMTQNTILVRGANIELHDDMRYCLSFNGCDVVSNGNMSATILPQTALTVGRDGLDIEIDQQTMDNLSLLLTMHPTKQIVRILSASVKDLAFS